MEQNQNKLANHPNCFRFFTGLSQSNEAENTPSTSRSVAYTDEQFKKLTIKQCSQVLYNCCTRWSPTLLIMSTTYLMLDDT